MILAVEIGQDESWSPLCDREWRHIVGRRPSRQENKNNDRNSLDDCHRFTRQDGPACAADRVDTLVVDGYSLAQAHSALPP